MAVHHLTVILASAAAQQLSATSTNCKEIQIQGESSGAAAFIGGDNTITSTDYGQSIPATSQTPIIIRPSEGTENLNSTWIIGTTGNKFHVLYVKP